MYSFFSVKIPVLHDGKAHCFFPIHSVDIDIQTTNGLKLNKTFIFLIT